ncbi:helix-turn-helix transcriptional regulator [Allorhizocola rhizosphaerae]|uniref:helix-turn-helix transcriptional regulator n=1 Tax=Allorhizocola rhizosphaerae TaxID=1872709 RepID=UPI0013C343BE|nr:helix-turn-helix transcriptional regulator [Allorhizocola rhizosphaerae]
MSLGPRTCTWLARDLGMSARRIEAATEELLAAGAIDRPTPSAKRDQPALLALPVGAVVSTLRQRRRPHVMDPEERSRRHHAVVDGTGLPHGPHPAGLKGAHLQGVAAVRERIAQLVAAERHEHLALNPEPAFTEAAVSAALPLERQLSARGVRLRNCGVPPSDTFDEAVHLQHGIPGEYRERPHIPTKLMVFDRRVALLPVDPSDLAAGALEIDQPAIVTAMVALFEEIWAGATLPRRTSVSSLVMTPRERAIVTLLAEGYTDTAVAQQLGLGQRTIAYSLRALMDRLGVENRFQLGLVLGAAKAAAPPAKSASTKELQ